MSPVKAAARIDVPVLLIHGARDRDTLPIHSQRVFDTLRSQKQMVTINAAHNDAVNSATLSLIEEWLNQNWNRN